MLNAGRRPKYLEKVITMNKQPQFRIPKSIPDLTEFFQEEMQKAGAALVGFADLRVLETRPFSELPVGVAIALEFDDPYLARNPGTSEADPRYIEAYYRNGRRLDPVVDKGVEILRAEGYTAWGYGSETFFDRQGQDMNPEAYLTSLYQHKTTATLSGLGWIGRMGVLVTPRFGPHVWLATIITDAPFVAAEPLTESRCGSCQKCRDACPATAITGESWQRGMARADLVDIKKCQSHRRKRGQLAGTPMCGLCLAACPFGKKAGAQLG